LKSAQGQWARFIIPLNGDAEWTRSDVNHLDMSHVDWIEIHLGAEKPGMKVWLDALSFEPPRAVASTAQASTVPIGEWFSLPIKPEEVRESWQDFGNGSMASVDNTLELQNCCAIYLIRAKNMSIRAQVKKGPGQHVQLGLRRSSSNSYFAWFNGGGDFGICRVVDSTASDVAGVHVAQEYNNVFDFEFRVVGDLLTVLANGEVVLQTRDQSVHTAGYATVGAWAGSGRFAKVELLIPDKESLVADDRPASHKP
jgi:hypothetical protein